MNKLRATVAAAVTASTAAATPHPPPRPPRRSEREHRSRLAVSYPPPTPKAWDPLTDSKWAFPRDEVVLAEAGMTRPAPGARSSTPS